MAPTPTNRPPKPAAPARTRPTLACSPSAQIARVIRERGLTPYQVGAISGVDHSAITRFLRGERDLMLSTADKLAAALGLDLVERPRRTRSVPKMGSAEDRGGAPVPKMGS